MTPLVLGKDVSPEKLPFDDVKPISEEAMNKIINQTNTSNPQIIQYDLKAEVLALDRKLKLEKLKPKLNFDVQLLAPGFDFFSRTNSSPNFTGNYYSQAVLILCFLL
jgi:hypothetical protein